MTDKQKVHGASTDEGTVRKAFATYFYDPSWKKGRPDQMDHWNTWNAAWQAALAHASSATVKENLTGGDGEDWHAPGIGEVHNKDHSLMIYCMRADDESPSGEIMDDDLAKRVCEALRSHPAPSAEDARDQWSGVPNVVRQMRDCASDIANTKSLTGKWVHDTLSWYADEIDQALAAERGDGK